MSKADYWKQPGQLAVIERMARDGKTVEQIARTIGVHRNTLTRWLADPVIADAMYKGRAHADDKVERALFRRAAGYTYTQKKRTVLEDGAVREETTTKEVPPDTVACIFWLKNRRPMEWRDRQDIDLYAGVEFVQIVDDTPRE